MFIENRIEKRNEQIVVYWEKLVRKIFKRFFRTKSRVTISSGVSNRDITYNGQNKQVWIKGLFNLQPKEKQLFAKLKQKKLNIPESLKIHKENSKRLFKRKRA